MADAIKYPLLGGDCPRCGQGRTTFDVLSASPLNGAPVEYECFARCRHCTGGSIAKMMEGAGSQGPMYYKGLYLTQDHRFYFVGWVIEIPDARRSPDHVPDAPKRVFEEAGRCEAIGAWDAAGTMFRKTLDVATRAITPKPVEGDTETPQNWKTYKDLRLRLDWLFEKKLLNSSLKGLSNCIHQDGNDAAHDETGIGESEAADLGDFCERVLEELYTTPGRIAENQRRREERRAKD